MNKLSDKLMKGSDLYNDLYVIRKNVSDNVFNLHDYGVTEHNIRHSCRIIDFLDKLYFGYFSKYFQLNYAEIFILLASAYLHDIGFYFSSDMGIQEFCKWKSIDFNIYNQAEFYRIFHPYISSYWILCNIKNNKELPRVFYGDEQLGYCIMKVIISHGTNFWEDDDYKTIVTVNGIEIKEKYLCYLFCFADTLDCDCRRNSKNKEFKKYLNEEKIFIRTHDYIKKISIKGATIEYCFCIPFLEEKNKELFLKFYINRILTWLEELIEIGRGIFCAFDFSLNFLIDIRKSGHVTEPSLEEYTLIKKYFSDR